MSRKRTFGPTHKFWDEALTLRKPPLYYTYEQIARRLQDNGADISARVVRAAFAAHAPVALRMPERNSEWLVKQHKQYLNDFDSWNTLEMLVLETLAEVSKYDQELESEILSSSERRELVSLRHSEIERAWRFTSELERLKRDLDPNYIPGASRTTAAAAGTGEGAQLVGAGAAAFLAGASMQELEKRVLDALSGTADSELAGLLGTRNISMVGEDGKDGSDGAPDLVNG